MCGIVGLLHKGSDDESLRSRLSAAIGSISHRGPDGIGRHSSPIGCCYVATLGHTRLSIIDLSDAGSQPFRAHNDRYSLTYNGELYNYLELRNELEALGVTFWTSSDTEVLIQSLIIWGAGALMKLEGMFAFAFVDYHSSSAILARDPFGIKPFYYHQSADSIGFGSEPRVLRHLFPELKKLNEKVAADFLAFGAQDKSDSSFFEGIHCLLPGTALLVDLRDAQPAIKSLRYWDPAPSQAIDVCFMEAQKTFRELLFKSVELHMRSDVPVGAALSGGLDSSSLVSIVRQIYPEADLHTFSYIASNSGLSEEKWVDDVLAWTGATGHKVSLRSSDLFDKDLDPLILAQGEPFPDLSIYAQYKVYELARSFGIKVTLDGQGADEYLAGYHGFPEARLKSLWERGGYIDLIRFGLAWQKWPGRSARSLMAALVAEGMPTVRRHPAFVSLARQLGFMSPQGKGLLSRETEELARFPVSGFTSEALDFRGRRLSQALSEALGPSRLSALLRVADRNSMSFSIESRLPFLNKELVEFTLSLPEHFLLSSEGETKHILRHALSGIVPPEILTRRDKVGFEAAISGWGRESQVLLEIENSLDDIPLVDVKASKRAIHEVFSGKAQLDASVWRILNFARWYKLEKLST